MTIIKRSTVKAAISASLAVALLGTTIGSTAMASNHGEHQIYRDANFGQIKQQLRQDLRSDGYYLMDIEADGNNRINAYAKKNNKPYELKYTYPGLKLISSTQKDWSKVWEDKNNHHNNYQDRNNHHNNGDDLEDRIKKESRYPSIKQSAINKIKNMGYQIDKIEIDEDNGQAIFEIEAKRGGQDYDIDMSYPDLKIIKSEKD